MGFMLLVPTRSICPQVVIHNESATETGVGRAAGVGTERDSPNSSNADVQPSGHGITCTSVKENSPPPLRCDAESVAGVQFVQLQKLFLGEDQRRVQGDPGS